MKKSVLMLIPLAVSFAAMAQRTDTQDRNTQKNTNKNYSKSDMSTLDGKMFKITLATKETGSVNQSASGSGQDQSTLGTGEKNSAQFSQTDIANLGGTKAKLKFENGMLKTSFKKMMSVENCPYRVTSGTTDMASFTAYCTLTPYSSSMHEQGMNNNNNNNNEPAGSNVSYPGSGNSTGMGSDNTNGIPAGNQNSNAVSGNSSTGQGTTATGTGSDVAMNTVSNTTVTGVVNGESINGTITFSMNGQNTAYSFTGSILSKKDKEDLGMK